MTISKRSNLIDENALYPNDAACNIPPSSTITTRFEQGKDSFNIGKYSEAFKQSNAIVHAIHDQYVNALELRATTLGRMAHFKAATNDAKTIIYIAPSSPLGYICHAELFSMRGNYQQAIRVFNKGLLHVETDKDRSLLIHRRDIAIKKKKTRFDLVSKLPNEIIQIILSYLDIKKRLMLLDVSKTWHQKVSECSTTWQKISISESNRLISKSITEEMSRIAIVSHHTKDLVLMDLLDAPFSEAIFSFMANGGFSKVEKLFINMCAIPNIRKFMKALMGTAALKKIILSLNFQSNLMRTISEIPLNSLLMACSNLQTLCVEFSGSIKFDNVLDSNHPSAPFVHMSLISLQLDFKHASIADLNWIYNTCPQLRHLIITGCESTLFNTIYSVFQKRLERLCFGTNLHQVINNSGNTIKIVDESLYDIASTIQQNQSNTTATGIRDVSFVVLEHPNHFISLFTNECTTLRTLRLSVYSFDSQEINEKIKMDWQSLIASISNLNHLLLLEICGANDKICDTIVIPLLRKAPNLCVLEFNTPSALIGQELMTTIADLQCLKRLVISECRSTDQDMKTLFRNLAAKEIGGNTSNQSTLEYLSIIYNDGFSLDDIVEYITAIPSLRHLEFDAVGGLTGKGLYLLCEKLTDHLRIHSIKLSYFNHCIENRAIGKTILQALAAIKRLSHLHLVGLSDYSRADLNVFTDTSIKLTLEACKFKKQ